MPTNGANVMHNVIRHLQRAALLRVGDGLSDGQLLEAFLARRDEAAFEALVRRHGPMVLSVCQRVLGNRHDAEDAFQATFLVLVRKAASLQTRELVGHWLYGVAYRTALKAKTLNARRRAREREMVRPEGMPAAVWQDLRAVLDRELNGLPEHYRVPIVLCDLEGMTRKEAARRLNVPAGTLSGRLTVARRLLGKRLARHGLALSGGALGAVLARNAAAACVPHPLILSTAAAALRVAAGAAAASVVSTEVAALTEGVLRAMSFTKVKVVTVVLLAAVLVGAGPGVLRFPVPAAGQTQPRPENAGQPAPGAEAERLPLRLLKHHQQVGPIAWGADGLTLVGITSEPSRQGLAEKDRDGAVRVWDLRSGAIKRSLADEQGKFCPYDAAVAVSGDGKTIAAVHSNIGNGSVTGEVLLWDAESGKLNHTLEHGPLGMRCIAFSPDSTWVASGTGGNLGRDFEMVKLWEVKTGKFLRSLDTTNKMAVKLAFSADSKMLAVIAQAEDRSQEALLWDPTTGKLLHAFGPADVIGSVAFVANGKVLAALTYTGTGDETRCALKLWDVATGKLKQTHSLAKEGLRLVDYWGELSPDGTRVAHIARQGDKPVVSLWDVKTGHLQDTREDPPVGRFYFFGFSLDGKTLAASSEDKTIKLWDLARRNVPNKE